MHLDHILFRDMLGILRKDLIETMPSAITVTIFLVIFRKDLLVYAFAEQLAKVTGLQTRLLNYGLLAVLSLTVTGALKSIGSILSVALLIAAGAIALLLTRRFTGMLVTFIVTFIRAMLASRAAA